MKRKMKRVMLIILAMALVVSILAACSGGQTTTATTGQTTSGTSSVTQTTQMTEESNINEGTTLPIAKNKITITAMASLSSWVSDLVNNTYTQSLEARTNVHLDLTVVPADGYGDKLKLALNTGDYTEIILSGAAPSNNDIVKYGMQEKIYIPINPYLDKYATNVIKCLTELPEVAKALTAPDGNIYGLPIVYDMFSFSCVAYKCWINVEWLDKLNLKKPTTTEEFKNVLTAFKTQDPNGNGEADEVPLSGANKTWAADPYLFLLNSFDYYDGLLKYKDGNFTFTADTEGFKQGLKYIAGLYADGLIDPASLTQDLAQLSQLGNKDPEVLGCFTAGHIGMGIDITNVELSKKYDSILPLKGPSGYQATPVRKMIPQGAAFAITDVCKNPEAAIRLIDMLFVPEEAFTAVYGPKGERWDVADEGATGPTGLPATWKMLKQGGSSTGEPTNDYWGGTTAYWMGLDSEKHCQFKGDIYDPANYGARLNRGTDEYLKYSADNDQILPMWVDTDVSANLNNSSTLLADYVNSSIVEFITGKKDVDKDWQTYIDGLNKLGYNDYVIAYAKAYNVSSN